MDKHGKQPATGEVKSSPAWRSLLAAYGFAMAVSGLTLMARLSLDPWLGKQSVLVLFILPIIFSAYVGGLGPGLLATAFCTLGSYHFLRTPEYILYFEGSVDLWQWAILIVVGVLISFLTETLRRSRKQAELTGQLHAITLASIGDAVITTDAQGQITFLNGEAERLTGWTNADAAGQPLPSVFHIVNQATRELVEDPVKKVFRTGMVVGLANHTVLIARDGREFVIDDSGAPIRQADGTIIGVVLVFRDNTAKKQAEDAVRESQALYHSLVGQMPAGIFRKNADGRYVFVNAAFCEMKAKPAEYFLGKTALELGPEETPQAASRASHHAQIMQTGQPVVVEEKHPRADGRTLFFHVVKTPVFNSEGAVTGTQGVLFDITERKQAEAAALESQALYHSLVDQMPAGVFRKDAAGRYVFVNAYFCRLRHATPDFFIGKLPAELAAVENPFKLQAAGHHAQIMRTGQPIEVLDEYHRADGQTLFFQVVKTPVFDAEGNICGSQGVLFDVTGRKQAEAALRESEERFRTMVEQASDAFFVHDVDGHLLDANQSACDKLGYTRPEILNLTVADLDPGLGLEEARSIWRKLRPGQAQLVRGQHRRKDGTLFPVEVNLTCYELQGRTVLAALARDISFRLEYEEKMARSVSLLRATIESSASGILAVDTQGKIAAYNQRFLQLWNLPEAMASSAQDESLLDYARQQLADPEAALSRAREIYAQPEAESFDTLLFKDGRVFERSSRPQRLGEKIIGRVWSFWDITERRRVETALRQERELLRTLVDLAPDFIFVKDTEGRYLVVNTALAACYGQTPATMLGRTDAEFLPADLAGRFGTSEHQTMTAAAFCTFEDTIRFPDGKTRAVMTNMAAFCDGQGRVRGLVGIGRDVTAQKAIEKSMRLQSVALEAAANSILITDHNGHIEWVNPAFSRSSGYTLAECRGKNPRELLRSGRHDRKFYRHLWDTILAGQVWQGEIFNRCKDGSVIQEEMTITPLLDRENRTTHFIAIRQDITERKRLEEEFEREQARFKLIFDTVPVGIALQIMHPDGQFMRIINDAHLRICGLTRDQHHEPGIDSRITHPDDRAVQQRFLKQVNAGTRKQYSMEKRYLHLDGKVVWVVFSYQRETYPDGTTEELTTVVDITERKAVEQQLLHLAVIVESSEDAIISKTLDGLITSWNHGAELVFGYPASETIGQPMLLLFPDELKHEEPGILSRIACGESVEHFETERIRKDGTRIRVSATISPLKDDQGKVVGASTIARDTTRQHILEEQLRQSQKMEAIGQLAGGVAHDFNNILAVIQMQTELSKIEGNFTPEQLGCLNEIQVAADRAAKLTRQLLLFSRRQRLQPRELDLSDSISGMTKMLRRILGEDIQMQFNYAPQPLFILADAGMMDQVVMNLALNSRDAMPAGGQLIIETAAVEFDRLAANQAPNARPGNFVRLSVCDTGCGIAPEVLPRIFEPFFTTKDVGKGTGLGLATVFSIVQQHQGWINVASKPGVGTTFHIYLPRLAKISARPPTVAAAPATASGGDETILLVEDDEALRASVRKSLVQLGYHLLEAANGAEALRLWQQHRDEIDLLLTDLVMPGGMSGKDLAGRLLLENPKLKVIYASGYSAEVAGKDFPLFEGVNFLSKPFPVQTLARTIRACLDRN